MVPPGFSVMFIGMSKDTSSIVVTFPVISQGSKAVPSVKNAAGPAVAAAIEAHLKAKNTHWKPLSGFATWLS